jgi:PKD repeat protein
VSQTISVNSTGVYAVTVTDPGGCSASITHNVTIQPLPVASFTTSNACLGSVTTINNSSSISSGNILTWAWDLGGGNLSSQQTPSISYPAAGMFPVSDVLIQ